MIDTINRPKKRLFLALILISLFVITLSTYGLWKVAFVGLTNISEYLPHILATILLALLFIIMIGMLGMIFAILGWPSLRFCQRQAWTAINLLFPLAVLIGKFINIDKEKTERSFIEVSNQLIRQRHIKVLPEQLLVITPHCLQEESCPHKITRNVKNCKKCGRCQIGALVTLSEELGFHFAVATGGTLSRQIIKNLRPKAVLAIACERDLTSGIQDIYPLPVIGVLNQRPCGPCNNTKVDVDIVTTSIKELLK